MTLAGNTLSFDDVREGVQALRETQRKRGQSQWTDEDTDVECALAALNEDNSAHLQETDVQQKLLAHKEPRGSTRH